MTEGPTRSADSDDPLGGALRAAFGPAETIPDGVPAKQEGVRGAGADRKSVVEILGEASIPVASLLLRERNERSATPVVRPPREGSSSIPSVIGRYQVAGEVARGGVGTVLKARDIDLGRDVALKVLLDEHGRRPEMVQRFVEEAQIGGQLQHPGIVPVHEMGLFAGERPYFAMKLVRGRTLATELEARCGPREGRQHLLTIFEKICEPIAYAHDRGVIHRDLKPSNIMIGSYGEVQVMDWGLAKVLSQGGAADDDRATCAPRSVSIHTVRSDRDDSNSLAGSVLGTPAYMSPEQARGEVDLLDERSDVFGLGAILCEILTGRPPYVGASVSDLHRQAKRGYLDDAFARLQSCGADRPMIELAKRCLAFEPRERPRDAGVLAGEVRNYLESLDERARQSELKAARVRTRARTFIVSVAAGATLVVSALWLVMERRNDAAAAKSRVQTEIARIRGLEAQVERRGGDLEELAAVVEAARTAQALGTDAVDTPVRNELRELLTRLKSDHRRRAFLLALQNASAGRGSGIEEAFLPAFETRFGRDFLRIPAREAADRIRAENLEDDIGFALDDWALRRYAHYLDWKPILEIALALATPDWRIRLYHTLQSGGADADATIDAVVKAGVPLLTPIGEWQERRGDPADAERLYLRAVKEEPDQLRARVDLMNFYAAAGRYEESLLHLEVIRALRDDVWSAWWRYTIPEVYLRLDRFDDALDFFSDGFVRGYELHWSKVFLHLDALLRIPALRFSEQALDRFIAALVGAREADRLHAPELWICLGAALERRFGKEALEHARSILPREPDGPLGPILLAVQARLDLAAGDAREAVRLLEIASRQSGDRSPWEHLLRDGRRAIGFELVSCASIDAALHGPEFLVDRGDSWRYFPGVREPSGGDEWTTVDFDDSTWMQGASGIGYGPDFMHRATDLSSMKGAFTTVYFRRAFEVDDPESFEKITLRTLADDGFKAWVNGALVGSDGVPAGRLSHDSIARVERESAVSEEIDITEAIQPGLNVVAILGVNGRIDSEDFTIAPEIEATPSAKGVARRVERLRGELATSKRPALSAYFEGRIAEERGDHRTAAEQFRESLQADRSDALPFWRLWNVLRTAGDPDEASRVLHDEVDRGVPSDLRAFPPAPPLLLPAIMEGRIVRLRAGRLEHADPRVVHTRSHWQVRVEGASYETTPAFDLVSGESLEEVELPPILEPQTNYRWRVTYTTAMGQSATSEEGSFTTGAFAFEPVFIDLSPVLNRDVIVNSDDSREDYILGGWCLMEEGFVQGSALARGLPKDRSVGVFRLADYSEPNVLRLTRHEREEVRVETPPRAYSVLCFLHMAANGERGLPVEIEYTDGPRERHVLHSHTWNDEARADPQCATVIAGLSGYHQFTRNLGSSRLALLGSFVRTDETRAVRAIVLLPGESPERSDSPRLDVAQSFNLFAVTGIPAD